MFFFGGGITSKKTITPTWLNTLNSKLATDRTHYAENLYPIYIHDFAKPNGFGDICEKHPSDPFVLF